MTTHRTMSYANALRMVLSDNVKIARMQWQTEEWLKEHDRAVGTRTWVGCISGREIGVANELLWWEPDNGADGGVILFRACQSAPTSMCAVAMGWRPSIADTLATDWYVVAP